jgi:NADPH2:quinone reductase
MSKPELGSDIGTAVGRLIEAGFVEPIVGARFPLARAADALRLIESRGAAGKVVLEIH